MQRSDGLNRTFANSVLLVFCCRFLNWPRLHFHTHWKCRASARVGVMAQSSMRVNHTLVTCHFIIARLSVARGDATCIIHTCGCVWKRGRVPTRSPSHSLTPQTPERKTFHSLNVAAWSPAREAWLSHAQPPFYLRLPGLLPQTSTVFRPLMRLTPSTPQHLDSGLSGGDWRLAQQVSALWLTDGESYRKGSVSECTSTYSHAQTCCLVLFIVLRTLVDVTFFCPFTICVSLPAHTHSWSVIMFFQATSENVSANCFCPITFIIFDDEDDDEGEEEVAIEEDEEEEEMEDGRGGGDGVGGEGGVGGGRVGGGWRGVGRQRKMKRSWKTKEEV